MSWRRGRSGTTSCSCGVTTGCQRSTRSASAAKALRCICETAPARVRHRGMAWVRCSSRLGDQNQGEHIDAAPADLGEPTDRDPRHRADCRPGDGRPPVRAGSHGDRRGAAARVAPLTATPDVPLRARLYDADGTDRDVDLTGDLTKDLSERRLLWVDVDRESGQDLESVAAALHLEPALTARLATSGKRPDLTKFEGHLHLALLAMEPAATETAAEPRAHTIDVVGGKNWVLTVHDGETSALERF